MRWQVSGCEPIQRTVNPLTSLATSAMVWPVNRHQGEVGEGSFRERFLISALDKTAKRRLGSGMGSGARGLQKSRQRRNYGAKRSENQLNRGKEILRRIALIR